MIGQAASESSRVPIHALAPPQQELMNAAPVQRSGYGNGDAAGLRALTAACRRGV